MNILSYSQVRMYNECGKKYRLHYQLKLRSKYIGASLLFGSAVDEALNTLLKTKDLELAKTQFAMSFNYQTINKVRTYLPKATNIVYAQRDFDYDLLTAEDHETYRDYKTKLGLDNESDIDTDLKSINKRKSDIGFENLEDIERKLYNKANWMSMFRKGVIMIESYYTKILPKFKRVIVVQKNTTLENSSGDKITMYLDLIVETQDGKIYLLDNKTSTGEYEEDRPRRSQQLVLYYHSEKEEYKLDGVGFVVLYKSILKNKTKVCSVCGFDGSGTSFRTCNNELQGKRCKSEWVETVDPECRIDLLLNDVPKATEDLVLETFDKANEAIEKGIFIPNLESCGSYKSEYRCFAFDYCHKGSKEGLIDLTVTEE